MERVMWQIIEDMDFNARGHRGASKYLLEESKLNLLGMKAVRDFATKKANELYSRFSDMNSNEGTIRDVCWQIVANGEEFYNNITKKEAQNMADENQYKESFEYSFESLW